MFLDHFFNRLDPLMRRSALPITVFVCLHFLKVGVTANGLVHGFLLARFGCFWEPADSLIFGFGPCRTPCSSSSRLRSRLLASDFPARRLSGNVAPPEGRPGRRKPENVPVLLHETAPSVSRR